QADECDAFDFDVDEAPTVQTMNMENLSSAYPVYDEAGPSYDSDILFERNQKGSPHSDLFDPLGHSPSRATHHLVTSSRRCLHHHEHLQPPPTPPRASLAATRHLHYPHPATTATLLVIINTTPSPSPPGNTADTTTTSPLPTAHRHHPTETIHNRDSHATSNIIW
nr:hypothetical protein [Tanacetum cinerariifolium]